MLISPGMALGRYRIRRSIGLGGMGEVFLADDTELGRPVALKVLLDGIGDGDPIRRFIQEAKAASALNHPNILTVYEIGTFDDARFIATEYIQGQTLRERLKRELLSGRETLEIAVQIAAALKAAHEAGIVHRDVKPENIMIRADGLVKVLDFGLAKLAENDPGAIDSEEATLARVQTLPGMVMGTVNYMSPEQARGRNVDARTDIWSLGVVIFEMLMGRTPFAEETTSDTMAAILKSEPSPLSAATPTEVARIVRKALQKSPNDRYQIVDEMLADLKNLKRELEFATEFERSQSSGSARRFNGVADSVNYAADRSTVLNQDAIVSTQDAKLGLSSGVMTTTVSPATTGSKIVAVLAILIIGAAASAAYFAYIRGSSTAITSIAVLPLVNNGGDASSVDLSDSVSDALINSLSKLPQLKVISRSSSFKYRNSDGDPQEIARALGVQSLVMGRFANRGDGVVINVEMINAADKSVIWSESYNRKIAEIQSVQDDITRNVSQKLSLPLSGEQQQQLTKSLTDNPEAYQLYLNGVFYARKRGVDNVRTAVDYQLRAIALDPKFARAYVELAGDYTLMVGSDLIDPVEGKQKARAAVEKALQLDETLADAHLALARIEKDDLDWQAAGRSFQRAIDLNPNLVAAHNLYAFYLACLERSREALAEIKRAQELDPLSTTLRSTEGGILFLARNYDQSIAVLSDAVARDPNDTFALAYLGLALTEAGRYDEAITRFEQVIKIQGETTSTTIFKARALALAGRRSEALDLQERLETTTQYVSPGELATLYVALGETDKAFDALNKAVDLRDLQLQFLRVDPGYNPIRNDQRFVDLLARVGLNI